jgi:hypothetical protein
MADPLDTASNYSSYIPPSQSAMGSLYKNVYKKNSNSSDPIGYLFDSYDAEQRDWEAKNPLLTRDSFIAEKAPEYDYAKNLPLNYTDPDGVVVPSFEAYVARAVAKDGATPALVQQAVSKAIADGIYALPLTDNPLAPYNYAKNMYQEYTKAVNDFAKDGGNKYNESPLGKLGLPDPAEDYNPTSFSNYAKWETGKINGMKKAFGDKFTPAIQKRVEAIYRARSVAQNRKDGRTPYRDALISYEATR